MNEHHSHGDGITTGDHSHGHGSETITGHDHSHGHGHGHAPFPFSDEERKEFEKDDIFAGGAVVVLMSAIFGIGLVLYTIIAWIVGS